MVRNVLDERAGVASAPTAKVEPSDQLSPSCKLKVIPPADVQLVQSAANAKPPVRRAGQPEAVAPKTSRHVHAAETTALFATTRMTAQPLQQVLAAPIARHTKVMVKTVAMALSMSHRLIHLTPVSMVYRATSSRSTSRPSLRTYTPSKQMPSFIEVPFFAMWPTERRLGR